MLGDGDCERYEKAILRRAIRFTLILFCVLLFLVWYNEHFTAFLIQVDLEEVSYEEDLAMLTNQAT